MMDTKKIGLGCNVHQTYGANGKIRWCLCLIEHLKEKSK